MHHKLNDKSHRGLDSILNLKMNSHLMQPLCGASRGPCHEFRLLNPTGSLEEIFESQLYLLSFHFLFIFHECFRARINRRPSMPLLLAVMPLKILDYLRPKKGCSFPIWLWCPCSIMCALLRGRNALFPTSCPFFRWTCPRYFSELFFLNYEISAQLWTEKI